MRVHRLLKERRILGKRWRGLAAFPLLNKCDKLERGMTTGLQTTLRNTVSLGAFLILP